MEIAYLYNPDNQSEKELIDSFVVRIKEFKQLVDALKQDALDKVPQHYIIQGQRGFGKTTLLLRINYEVRRTKKLNKFLLPVQFSEEQYHIRTLDKLWEEIAECLAEEKGFEQLSAQINVLEDNGDLEEKSYELLFECLKRQQRRAVLLIDNFGELLEKFSRKEHQRLREVLITNPYIQIIGASSAFDESINDYEKPFFDFYKNIQLQGLSSEETNSLLKQLGKQMNFPNINTILKEQKGRVEALRRLTGGVPRTMILLFGIFMDNESGNSFKDLEIVLDKVTPLYKHRMDELSPVQQEIAHAIAMSWDAVGVKELVEVTDLESKVISAQITQLEKHGIVNKIPTNTKNNLYQIKERFFNIWYLMRYGKRNTKNKVRWFVEFLQIWCDEVEITGRMQQFLDQLKKGDVYDKYAFHLSEALAQVAPDAVWQNKLLSSTRDYLRNHKSELAQMLSKSDFDLLNELDPLLNKKKYSKILGVLEQFEKMKAEVAWIKADCYIALAMYKEAVSSLLGAIDILAKFERLNRNIDISSIYFNLAVIHSKFLHKPDLYEKYFALTMSCPDISFMREYIESVPNGIVNKFKVEILSILKMIDSKSANQRIMIAFLRLFGTDYYNDALTSLSFTLRTRELYESEININQLLLMVLAKKQYEWLYQFLERNQDGVKDRYKPYYYVTLHFLKDKYPNGLKRIGAEMQETVNEIIEQVESFRKAMSAK